MAEGNNVSRKAAKAAAVKQRHEEEHQPHIKECSVSYRSGGKVSIVKYDMSMDYNVSQHRTYIVPEDWDEEKVAEFWAEKFEEIKKAVDAQATVEFDHLVEQSEVF